MYNSKNYIKQSEITITPTKLKYSSSYATDGNAEFDPATNISYTVGYNDSSSLYTISGQGILYRSIRQLYYQNYLTGSLLNSASYWNYNPQSTACSGSSDYENRYFPTESNDLYHRIGVFSIPRQLFGEQISPNTFCLSPLSSNDYKVIDDGNGNLIDVVNGNVHVGNIIYSQGIVIITDNIYVEIFTT